MSASHLCGQVSSPASSAPQSRKHPPPRPCLAHSKRSTNITCCSIPIIICTFPSGKGRRRGKGQQAGAEGGRRRGPGYPCRCPFPRWGRLCGRRRGRGSPRTAPAGSRSRRAGGRTPHSRSSRPARLAPRGRSLAASRDTGPDTGRDSAGWPRPGAGGTRRRKLSAGTIEGGVTRAAEQGPPWRAK